MFPASSNTFLIGRKARSTAAVINGSGSSVTARLAWRAPQAYDTSRHASTSIRRW